MKHDSTNKKYTWIQKSVATILLVFLLVVSFFIPAPRQANAQFGGGILGTLIDIGACALDLLGGFLSVGPTPAYASVPVHETALAKEGCPDIEAWFFAKLILRDVVGDIIDWVKSGGYDGRPLFVQDFTSYFVEAEDRGKGIFLSELQFVQEQFGEPFAQDVANFFTSSVQPGGPPHAQYDANIPDPQAFYDDYSKGGLEAWYETMLNPANNVWGTITIEGKRLSAQQATEFEQSKTETLSYEGFIGDKDCLGTFSFGGQTICIRFDDIKIPGSNAQDILNEVFETDITTLEDADEISEVILTFINRLILGGIMDFDTSSESLNPIPQAPEEEETTPGGSGGGGGGSTPTGQVTATPVCLTNGPPAVNISWDIDTGNVANTLGYARYCVGQGCVPTTSSPPACVGTTSCVHTGGLPSGGVYSYRVFVYQTVAGPTGIPLAVSTNVSSATISTCN
ncbi:MAG: hypothetical protein Q8O83_00055 [bacterium]|nr:hypothetical protein [bacterium]